MTPTVQPAAPPVRAASERVAYMLDGVPLAERSRRALLDAIERAATPTEVAA